MTFRSAGLHQGTHCDSHGDPIDTGPPAQRVGDSVVRLPLTRLLDHRLSVCGYDWDVIQEGIERARALGCGSTPSELLAAICRHYLETT